jgi:DNA-binding transcriptional ArsR family regulator
VTLLEEAAVVAAIADKTRCALLRVLADGAPQSVNDLAERLGREADGISKHLKILRDARMLRLVNPPGSDRRKQLHELPAVFRSRDAAGKTILDFGAVLLRVN